MDYEVKNIELAEQGKKKIELAEERMPVLMGIRRDFREKKPLENLVVGIALHVTKETAALVKTLETGGAKVAITGCNPLSTQDDVAAYLAKQGTNVFAWREETNEEYYKNLNKVLDYNPDFIIDDGADLISLIHKERKELLKKVKGGCEETTTGVMRLRAMEKDNALEFPVIAVNDADTKHLFDNRYGTGQSTIDGILRSSNTLLAGKNFVVSGYGWCGKGIAKRAKGMDSDVIVTEVDYVKAIEARMDGYKVMPIAEAAKIGDIFVTATGNRDVITIENILAMKEGAIVANSGHFNIEIELDNLGKKERVRENFDKYTLSNGKHIYVAGEGRLVNLACAEGHPSEVMDMSFANQVFSVKYLNENNLSKRVYIIPKEIDNQIAALKLETMGIKIDTLTPKQKEYLNSWKEGT